MTARACSDGEQQALLLLLLLLRMYVCSTAAANQQPLTPPQDINTSHTTPGCCRPAGALPVCVPPPWH